MAGVVAVLDIGKTNVKLEVFAPDGALLLERSIANRVAAGAALSARRRRGDLGVPDRRPARGQCGRIAPIDAIVPTTHACAGALIDEAGLAAAGDGL